MKTMRFQLEASKEPFYKRLAGAIRKAIRTGALKPGEQLPSTRDIANQCHVHRHTVMNAMAELVAEGWIESNTRHKYRVTKTLPSAFLQAKKVMPHLSLARRQTLELTRCVKDFARSIPPVIKHQFPSGLPDVRLFPKSEFKSHLYDSLKSTKVFGYGDPLGHPRLIQEVATYLRRVRSVANREIVITHGSQEAIFLLAQLLVRPGDFVAVEELGYPPAFAALKHAGATLLPIKIDSEGLVVDDLERMLKTKKIRLLYLTPLHQYPTTVTLSARRRLQLYELACKHGLAILEDDYDHEFHYDSQPVAPLASFDPAGLVMYVSTFSKVLYPSSRIGFMAVPHYIAQEIAKLKRISSRQNESITQEALARWMKDGGFERHLRRMRRTYEQRRNGMTACLEDMARKNHRLSWVVPEGGMALWLKTECDTDLLAASLYKRSIHVTPESWYRVDHKAGTHLRLGFSGQTPEENAAGLLAIFKK